MARLVSGVPDLVVYGGGIALLYYFFIYESDEQKAKRIQREGLARQMGGRARI